MTWAILGLIPWLGLGGYLALRFRAPRPLGAGGGGAPPDTILPVSVIVPARNEARSIGRCVASLAALRPAPLEILVVDDRSEDGTAGIARSAGAASSAPVRVIDGRPLPEGWFGKPWACAQGAEAARGELLLFTDADTRHHPELLGRAVEALEEDSAGALSLAGRQELGTFWERLVQPHLFAGMAFRYARLEQALRDGRWRDAIANGQYILFRREVYEAIGGHGAVRGEVVEDLRLAQELVRRGHRLTVRGAEDLFGTRMYTSLREIVDGWTKNVATGGRLAFGRWGGVAAWAAAPAVVALWIVPPLVLLAGIAGLPPPAVAWAAAVTLLSAVGWAAVHRRMGVPALYGALFPVAAAVVAFIFARSALRGSRRIEWKGRRYGEGGSGRGARGPGRPP